ncbi:MAG: ComEA family DNA-binding protein [Solobacterium sp.]|nr:ComEA family DNA-binding protein [Solobacterium sp.]
MKYVILILMAVSISFLTDLKPLAFDDFSKDTISVTVEGEVEHPGTYEVPVYASVSDVLAKAETTSEADLTVFNPASILADSDILIIPAKAKEGEPQRISINTAGLSELCLLPGIGEATAARIIAYREEYGLFQSLEDLMQVSGIGEKKFAKIKDMICL